MKLSKATRMCKEITGSELENESMHGAIKPKNSTRKSSGIFLAALILPALAAACGDTSDPAGKKVTLILGAYTTPREAYGKAIIPAFQRYWKEKTGQEVEFRESYQGSGAQSRAIIAGFEADIAVLSLEGDIDRIAEASLITHDWKSRPN